VTLNRHVTSILLSIFGSYVEFSKAERLADEYDDKRNRGI
jgi:hypothetical protein